MEPYTISALMQEILDYNLPDPVIEVLLKYYVDAAVEPEEMRSLVMSASLTEQHNRLFDSRRC